MSRMLLGQSQEALATAMKEYFSTDHYNVHLENTGWRILDCLRENQYDVIVLEIALPGLDGISLVRGYRSDGGSAPVVLIADTHSSDELQEGLNSGADSYLAKPFRLPDLAAQLKALLRRPHLRKGSMLRLRDIVLDSEARSVTRNDVPILLHPMEFKLLQFLMSHPNQVFSAQVLFERIWQKDKGFGQIEDTVRTHIRTLRKKMDPDGRGPIITTVQGLGYKVSDEQDASRSREMEALVCDGQGTSRRSQDDDGNWR